MDFADAWNEARDDLGYTGYYEEGSEEYDEIKGLAVEKIRNDSYENEFFVKKKEVVYRYISSKLRYEVLKRQKWKCNMCLKTLKYDEKSKWDGVVAHIDHIHPFSQRKTYPNGENNINESSNLQALCPNCNLSKTKKEMN